MFDPRRQAVLQLVSFKNAKHATKRIVRRETVWQCRKLFEPALISSTRPFDDGPCSRPSDCAALQESHYIIQQMIVAEFFASHLPFGHPFGHPFPAPSKPLQRLQHCRHTTRRKHRPEISAQSQSETDAPPTSTIHPNKDDHRTSSPPSSLS